MLIGVEATWFWVGLGILTAWRVTSLLCYEDGPFGVLVRVRRAAYVLRLGTLIECFHCVGLWVSALVGVALFRADARLFVIVIAMSGGVSLLELAVAPRRERDLEQE